MSRFFKSTYMLMVYLFLYIPVIILVVNSFNSSKYMTGWRGFTLDWYSKLASNTMLIDAAVNSFTVAFLSASAATVIGTLTAVTLYRYSFFGKKLLYALVYVVIMSPDIVTGISLLVLFASVKIELGFWTLLVSHITFSIPFVVVTVFSRLSGFDKNVIEAAKDLGADEMRIFKSVILPMSLPAVAAGWLLSFTLSLDDVIVSFFVTGPGYEVLPLRIFSMVRLGVKPEINALCAIILLFSLVMVMTSQFLMRERK
jgi:spermidine/putrescine transport system permease protein